MRTSVTMYNLCWSLKTSITCKIPSCLMDFKTSTFFFFQIKKKKKKKKKEKEKRKKKKEKRKKKKETSLRKSFSDEFRRGISLIAYSAPVSH